MTRRAVPGGAAARVRRRRAQRLAGQRRVDIDTAAALAKALKQPEVTGKLGDLGVSVGSGNANELRAFLPNEYQRVGNLIKTAKIKAD